MSTHKGKNKSAKTWQTNNQRQRHERRIVNVSAFYLLEGERLAVACHLLIILTTLIEQSKITQL